MHSKQGCSASAGQLCLAQSPSVARESSSGPCRGLSAARGCKACSGGPDLYGLPNKRARCARR